MELRRPRTLAWKVEALDRAVVERHVRSLALLRRLDREAVVLGRNKHAAGCALEHRMVRAAVTERQLVRLHSGREREQLMPEADAEDRHTAEQVAHRSHFVDEGLGIAWPVREQHAVVARELVRIDVVGKDGHRGAGGSEPAEDRALDAVVDHGDAHIAALGVRVRLLCRHAGDERATCHRRLCLDRRERFFERHVA